MRRLVDRPRLQAFMRELGRRARHPGTVYLTGGASAVAEGWRASTVDVDLKLDPEHDELLKALPELKERLELNVELASPADFVPPPPGWELRSVLITREGPLAFYHYDFYAQALSKLERGHAKDLGDVREMVHRGLVDLAELRRLFDQVEPDLYRYPALDPSSFRRKVEEFTTG